MPTGVLLNGSDRVLFIYHGKRRWFTLGKVSRQEANTKAAQVDYPLLRLKHRLIELAPGIDIADFVEHDGHPPERPAEAPVEPQILTQPAFRNTYLESHEPSLERGM